MTDPHDDYTRGLVLVGVREYVAAAEMDEAKRIKARIFIGFHRAEYGCVPADCPRCQDPEYVKLVHGSNDFGEPVDDGGGLAAFLAHLGFTPKETR